MNLSKVITKSPQETMSFAEKLAKNLAPSSIICLMGDLGTGKTTFVKGLAKGLKINSDKVSSPTFVLMNVYEGKLSLYHFDLYRLENIKEIEAIGYEEFLYGKGIAVIEWAERLGKLMPKEYLKVELSHHGDSQRLIKITALGKQYENIGH